MRTAKFYGEVYEVRKTGTRTKAVKPHIDLNGYPVAGSRVKINIYGLFSMKTGNKAYSLGGAEGREVFDKMNRKVGEVVFKETPEEAGV